MKRFAVIGLAGLSLVAGGASYTDLKRDERIDFYPTIARRVQADTWQIEIRGSVYEPEHRGVALAAFREALELKHIKMSPAEERIFNERARLFLVDHERRKRVVVRIAGNTFTLDKTKADGGFSASVIIRQVDLDLGKSKLGRERVEFSAVVPASDKRSFIGEAFLLEDHGLSVISDIDDTIKITQVRDRHATLRNTFLREFEPVPGMATVYQTLARSNHATFHYVSASPWQLYTPLSEFIRSNGFPSGTFSLKKFRWKDRSFLSLFSDPEKYKAAVMEPLLKQSPHRRFILIGDSGERDPEIYGRLARKYPRQVYRIFIRNVTGEPAEAERYRRAFEKVPEKSWQVFHDPAEIRFALP